MHKSCVPGIYFLSSIFCVNNSNLEKPQQRWQENIAMAREYCSYIRFESSGRSTFSSVQNSCLEHLNHKIMYSLLKNWARSFSQLHKKQIAFLCANVSSFVLPDGVPFFTILWFRCSHFQFSLHLHLLFNEYVFTILHIRSRAPYKT